ncbi:DMT family transporter [Pseudenterobacter timonensis]|uniref:DMT family transporter n=1 Tax=Pseudenterobacter timonensis TaxID=1755099 RepID=A0AAE4ITX2_9ENTR|nr:DMT family transporter [Pseudenterobacter timonensis]MDR9889600.1 DMT family transporter [Pseudenterobacter timonensis]
MNHAITNGRGYAFAALGGFILSFDTILLRLINLPPVQIAFWRAVALALPVICLVLFRYLRYQIAPDKKSLFSRDMLLSAFFYGLSSVLFPMSAMLTSIANMLFIISTAPLWAGILGWLFLKEKVSKVACLSFILSLTGVLIVISETDSGITFNPSIGDLIALMTAILMAAAFVVGRGSAHDLSLSPSVGAILAAIVLFSGFDIHLDLPARTLSLVILEGAVVVFLALSLIARASRFIPSSHLGLFLLLETILGPVWIYLAFAEKPGESSIVGGGIILAALLLNSGYSLWQLKYRNA